MAGERQYRDPRRLTQWLCWLLIATALLEVLFVAAEISHVRFLSRINSRDFASAIELRDAAQANELQRMFAIGGLSLAFVGSVILFAVWTYRMNSNIHALGATNPRFTPGWAAGWYFVPIANLWKPYQVLCEIWRTSLNLIGWQSEPTRGYLAWWWFWWLAACTVGTISVHFTSSENKIAGEVVKSVIDVVQGGIWFVSLSVAVRMVRRLGALQAQAADRSLSAVFA